MSDRSPDAQTVDADEPAATATTEDAPESGEETDGETADPDVLQAQLELLEAENSRLREEYVRARQSSYRRTATGLAAIGVVGVLAAIAFPFVRDVLLVLGAIGLFGGILTYYLTPERFVAAETGDRIVAAQDRTLQSIAAQLDLTDTRLYVPDAPEESIRLFVPQRERPPDKEFSVPDPAALAQPFVTDPPDHRGLSVTPAGRELFREFERTSTEGPQTGILARVELLTEALVEQFELVNTIETETAVADGRVTVRLGDAVYGGSDRFEDPLASFLAVGLARHLDQPVRATWRDTDDDRVVTVHWNPEKQ